MSEKYSAMTLLSQALLVTLGPIYIALNSNSGGQCLNYHLYFVSNITVHNSNLGPTVG